MSSYLYKENIVASTQDLLAALANDGVIVEEFVETDTTDNQKYYNPSEFLNDAQFYYSSKPRNYVQTASKLWLAAVYTLKEYYLPIEIHFISHRAMKYFADLAIDQYGSGQAEEVRKLTRGWDKAEMFHRFSYGDPMDLRKFPSAMADVQTFVENFNNIDKTKVKQTALKLLGVASKEITFNRVSGKLTLGRNTYDYRYIAC